MGKRLKRIFQKDIPAALLSLMGREAQFILKDKSTVHGIVSKVKTGNLEVKDYISGKHVLNMNDIEEIIIDFVAPY